MIEDCKHLIEKKIKMAFAPAYLEIIDESDKHIGHAGYQGGGRHFAVIITSDYFNDLSRVDAHRQIYTVLNGMIPEQIHALRIQIQT